jgi:hypothetical protein
MSMASYELVFVMPDGSTISRVRPDAKTAHNSLMNYPVKKAAFGARYYPSRKAWKVFDLREARPPIPRGRYFFIPPAPQVFEHEDKDAAVMWVILRLNG